MSQLKPAHESPMTEFRHTVYQIIMCAYNAIVYQNCIVDATCSFLVNCCYILLTAKCCTTVRSTNALRASSQMMIFASFPALISFSGVQGPENQINHPKIRKNQKYASPVVQSTNLYSILPIRFQLQSNSSVQVFLISEGPVCGCFMVVSFS